MQLPFGPDYYYLVRSNTIMNTTSSSSGRKEVKYMGTAQSHARQTVVFRGKRHRHRRVSQHNTVTQFFGTYCTLHVCRLRASFGFKPFVESTTDMKVGNRHVSSTQIYNPCQRTTQSPYRGRSRESFCYFSDTDLPCQVLIVADSFATF